jgi:hypothetical protein
VTKSKVVITVDTEPSIVETFADPERNKPCIHEPIRGEVEGKSHALGFIRGTPRRHRPCATFFVETVHVSDSPKRIMRAQSDNTGVCRESSRCCQRLLAARPRQGIHRNGSSPGPKVRQTVGSSPRAINGLFKITS